MHKIFFPTTNDFSLDMGAQSKDLELEPVKFEEIDSTYLGGFTTYNSLVLSAITSTKAKLNRTMSAFMRSLNKSLIGTNIKAGQKAEFYDDGGQSIEQVGVLLSKPRKAGLFAVMTAQIPCSDGQSISIIFYAPDEDPLKISEDDTLVAFRFLLNKRDITHKVAPSQGRDISLSQTTQALANLLEKNSAKFRSNLNKAMADRKEYADKQEELERLQDELTKTLTSISEIKVINDDLFARRDKLKVERDQTEKRFVGLKAKIHDFKPEREPMSFEEKVAAVKKDIEEVIMPLVEKAIASVSQPDDRAPNTKEIRALLREHYISFVADDVSLESNDQVAHLMYAADSVFADTVKVELQNGGWAKVEKIDKPRSTEYDPNNEYDAMNSIAGIKKYAEKYGVKVNIEMDMPDFESAFDSLIRVELKKHDSTIYMQIAGDGKMAVFSQNGERLNKFHKYSFFGSYSNDSGTLEERVEAFSMGADDLAMPEALKRHLETLEKISAGGFVVEEAVEQLSDISEYLETGVYWDYYGEKFNAAADLVADAIEARLEASEDDK